MLMYICINVFFEKSRYIVSRLYYTIIIRCENDIQTNELLFFSIYIYRLHKNLNRIIKKRMVPIESFVTSEMIDEDLYSRYHKRKTSFKNQKQIKLI